MRRVPIRIKLLGALAVPLLGLLTIIVVELTQASRDVREVRTQTHLATATIGPAGLLSTLQNERSWAVAQLSGAESSVTLQTKGYPETREATDGALAAFREDLDQGSSDVAAVYRPALDNIGKLAALRQEIDARIASGPVPDLDFADGIFDRYADLTSPFLDANSRLSLAIDNPGLRQGAELIDVSSRQIETLADLSRTLIQGGLSGDFEERDEIIAVASLAEQFEQNAQAIKDTRREPYRSLVESGYPEKISTDLLAMAETAISGGQVPMADVLAVVDVPVESSYAGFRTKTADLLDDEAGGLKSNAAQRGWLYRLFALVAIGVAVLATWWVSRSITRPLRALTRQATDMANHRLPDAVLDILDTPLGDDVTVPKVEPITVKTRDEVADVADALNTVQDSALDLAVEQAVLRRNIADSFVNLGRRNQNLLGRQLDFITELEHNETDPDTLANLFRLDHLATRMRRNAESLLVLAGIDPPRKWAAPVRITDAIRAALGEVEDYQRVTVRTVEATTIVGSAAADLAHLLAELIENALIFSPPDQTVEIRGRSQGGGYTLAIIDSGLGMPPEELSRANRRLAGAESFTIAPSKYLGHYVAGNLAARHNINVTLHNSPGHGITATINLPPTLLTTGDAADLEDDDELDAALGAPELQTEFIPRADDAPPIAARRSNGHPPAPPLVPSAAPAAAASSAPVSAAPAPSGPSDQTQSGLAKRARTEQHQAIPTRPNRPRPPAPDDELIRSLAAYTTGLQSAVTDVPPPPGDYPSGPDLPSGRAGSLSRHGDYPPGPSSRSGAPSRHGNHPTGPDYPPAPESRSGNDYAADQGNYPAGPGDYPPAPESRSGSNYAADQGNYPAGPDYPGDAGSDYPAGDIPVGRSSDYPADAGPDYPGADIPVGRSSDYPSDTGPDYPAGDIPVGRSSDYPSETGSDYPGADYPGEQPPTSDAPGAMLGDLPRRRPAAPQPRPGRRGRHAHGPGNGQGEPPPPPPPGTEPRPLPTDDQPASTPSGLQRRVRGAQMPTTEPVNLRRGGGTQGPPSRGAADSRPARRGPTPEPPESNGDHRAADEVYGFLSSFSAGVQRGLDEARHDDDEDTDDR